MKIFLDDYRIPKDCLKYMHERIKDKDVIYDEGGWYIVRHYPAFVKAIDEFKGIITVISFDHDLADGHYHKNIQEGNIDYTSTDFTSNEYNKTGYHAAQYFQAVYDDQKLDYPTLIVHSMNPVGAMNIVDLFKTKKKR